jgi:hypothetical protein
VIINKLKNLTAKANTVFTDRLVRTLVALGTSKQLAAQSRLVYIASLDAYMFWIEARCIVTVPVAGLPLRG